MGKSIKDLLFGIAIKEVKGNFNCSDNQLTSLEGCPEKVEGSFYCSFNKLTSLKNIPKIIDGSFNCSYNKLLSLEGSPETVRGVLFVMKINLSLLKDVLK